MSSASATTTGFPTAHAVTVTARHTLRCAHEESLAALESPMRLGAFDQLVMPFIPVAVVFVYRTTPMSSSTSSMTMIPVQRLQQAIELLLDSYPHLTGRLQFNSTDKNREITRLGAGAELLLAECSRRLDECCATPDSDSSDASASGVGGAEATSGRVHLVNLPDGGNALLAPFDPTLDSVCNNPIFTIQHTRFACGGVALGVRILHTVCDSDGFFQLMRDLAEIYRGLRASEAKAAADSSLRSGIGRLACPPHIRPYLSELNDMTPEERQAALEFKPEKFYIEEPSGEANSVVPAAQSTTDAIPAPVAPVRPPVVGRVLRFSGRELDALKAHATDPSGRGWVSTFEALSAHIYQCVYRARIQLRTTQGMSVSEAASGLSRQFLTPINWRGADRLNLPARYFSNAVLCAYNDVPHDVLADGPLWQVAKAIHDLTRKMSREQARQILRWIAVQPDKSRVRENFCYAEGSLLISQWCKFDMYVGLDFDVDEHGESVPPALVSTPFTPISLIDGLGYFLATEEQLQSAPSSHTCAIDVNLALNEPLWSILDQDEHFRQYRPS